MCTDFCATGFCMEIKVVIAGNDLLIRRRLLYVTVWVLGAMWRFVFLVCPLQRWLPPSQAGGRCMKFYCSGAVRRFAAVAELRPVRGAAWQRSCGDPTSSVEIVLIKARPRCGVATFLRGPDIVS